MKKVLLFPVGSSGDVNPFIALGREFKNRGFQTIVVTNGFFRGLAERSGLEFIELGSKEEYSTVSENPDLWHPRRALPLIIKMVVKSLEPMIRIIQDQYVPGETVVVCGSLAYGARVAQEKFKVPTAMIHLQPSIFRSVVAPPALPGFVFPKWMPPIGVKAVYWLIDRAMDRELGKPLNALMKTLGLPPVRNVMGSWWNSPDLTVGLFPDWYFPPPPDWEGTVKLTGFPMFDGDGVQEMSPGVEEFLNTGEPPIVFTGGSAMKTDRKFFAESVEACIDTGLRGILVAQHGDQIPGQLPPNVKHFAYAPFSRIFPRAAAIVHHGGIGTLSQGFKAGRPQLIVPLAHDHFDNALRVERLGAGLKLDINHYTASTVGPLLRRLTQEPSFAQTAGQLSARVNGPEAVKQTCDFIEKLL